VKRQQRHKRDNLESVRSHKVNRILSQAEIQALLAMCRRELMALVPKAIEVYRYHLNRNSLIAATSLLEGLQVLVKRTTHVLEADEPLWPAQEGTTGAARRDGRVAAG